MYLVPTASGTQLSGISGGGTRYYDSMTCRYISPDLNAMNPYTINGLNLYAYANGSNPISVAPNNVPNTIAMTSGGIMPVAGVIGGGGVSVGTSGGVVGGGSGSGSGWVTNWFTSEGPWNKWKGSIFSAQNGIHTFSVGTLGFGGPAWNNDAIQLFSLRLDVLRYDRADGLYATVGTGNAFLGFNSAEGKFGVQAKASLVTVGKDFRFISTEVDIGSFGVTFMWENGKLKLGFSYFVGGTIGIDFVGLWRAIFG